MTDILTLLSGPMDREQKLEQALKMARSWMHCVEPRLLDTPNFRRDMEALDAALSDPKAEAVTVKPLEWVRGWMEAEAETEVGLYKIRYRRDGSFEWSIGTFKRWSSSWDSAIAAAQADYEAHVLSAIDTSQVPKAEAVAWRREWNYRGHPCAPEFTDSPGLAEQWETHPQTDKVSPLYTSPVPALTDEAVERAADELPWCDMKVAFDVSSDSAVWEAYAAGDLRLPDGWEINETDCSGARCVAIFRLNRLPSTDDGRAVAALLAAFPSKGGTNG